MKGIELIEPFENNGENTLECTPTTTTRPQKSEGNGAKQPLTIKQAAAENFGKILELAGSIVEIKKMKVASDAILRKMEEDRKMLLAEAEAYVEKKNADTRSIVDRMNVIRQMMQDFYNQSNVNISGEEFRQTITCILDHFERTENG